MARDVVRYKGEADFDIGPVGSGADDFDESDLEVALAYMKQCRAIDGKDPEWEQCARYARTQRDRTRYQRTHYRYFVPNAPTATAGRASLPDDGSFSESYPTTKRGSGFTTHRVSDANSTDLPPEISQTVMQRLGVHLTPATPAVPAAAPPQPTRKPAPPAARKPGQKPPPPPVVAYEDVTALCGHVEKFGLFEDKLDKHRDARRLKVTGRACKGCRALKHQAEQERAQTKSKKSQQRRGVCQERLPHGAVFHVTYDAAAVLWNGTLSITREGEALMPDLLLTFEIDICTRHW
jgi:hypothetical protein